MTDTNNKKSAQTKKTTESLTDKFGKLGDLTKKTDKSNAKKTAQPTRPSAAFIGGVQDAWRFYCVWAVIVLIFVILIARLVWVQVINVDFYLKQGNRFLTTQQKIPTTRGMIVDTNGAPLAANAPLSSVFFNPHDYALAYYEIKRDLQKAKEGSKEQKRLQEAFAKLDLMPLSQVTKYPYDSLKKAVNINETLDVTNKEAVKAALPKGAHSRRLPLLKSVTPELAAIVMQLQIKGVFEEQVKKRYYLQPEPNAQLLGYMSGNGDEYKGRAGIESKYEHELSGQDGVQLVLRTGNAKFNNIEQIQEVKPQIAGKDIELTVDSRLQYLLHKELAALGTSQSALSSSGIVVDVRTGDVLAMSSWPSLNSNKLTAKEMENTKNRVVADIFEPGSVVKPFTVAAALASGKYNKNTPIDTSPGSLRLGNYVIKDAANYGVITMTKLLQKSSNVASAKIALSLPADAIATMQKRFGLGQKTAMALPSEGAGVLKTPKGDNARRATMGYGYGLSVTLAQIAQAYAALGNDGLMHHLRVVKSEKVPEPVQVIKPEHAQAIVAMMQTVTEAGGTGTAAAINGYHVAGKTGTSRRSDPVKGGYLEGQYRNVFAGVAPASNPRFAVVILVEDPQKQKYAGQTVAPVFAKVMKEVLRLYNVPFDKALDMSKER